MIYLRKKICTDSITGTWYSIVIASVLALCTNVFPEPPPQLPGNDITGTYIPAVNVNDTSLSQVPVSSPYSPEWTVQAMKTWDAPSLIQQMEEDASAMPIGKGAVFIPRLSEATLEPDIQIFDTAGKLCATGVTGKKYPVIPGRYEVMVGSGSDNQRIKDTIIVQEGAIIPIVPEWCGLTVDIVDTNNIPFRGQYELARIDEFQAYGRSYGRDQALGEQLKTWILSPGLYKVFTVGDGYNSLNNFITVRLLPGELTHVTVVENASYKIQSGGILNANAVPGNVNSHWKYRLNIGGTFLFNANLDHVDKTNTKKTSTIAMLLLYDLMYKKNTTDWQTNTYLKEGLNISDVHLSDVDFTTDELRITSLAVWRVILPWLGPYCRTEIQTHALPMLSQFSNSATNHYFIMLAQDSTIKEIDSSHSVRQLQPSLSPFTAEIGVGTNIDAISTHSFDAKLRIGVGYSQLSRWNQKYERDSSYVRFNKIRTGSGIDSAIVSNALSRNYIVIQEANYVLTQSYGPEAGITFNIRAGSFGLARGDWRMRIPIDPLLNNQGIRPDYDVNTTLSWLLTRSLTLDYLYQYTLKQPVKSASRYEVATHSVFLRFSFNSR